MGFGAPHHSPYNAPMSLTVTAIDHIQITCAPEQEAATVAFYLETMGLSEIEKPNELKARGGAWFQLGTQQLHIGVDKSHGDTTKAHICFLVADLDAAQSALAAAGVEITPEPIDATGLKRFFVRDPAGNRVEIGAR